MAGWKEWAIGEVVEAGDMQSYIQDQTVMVFASAAARTTALGTAVTEGMVTYRTDGGLLEFYNGSAWTAVDTDTTLTEPPSAFLLMGA